MHDSNQVPIANAEIKLNNGPIGKTNSNGMLSFDTKSCNLLNIQIEKEPEFHPKTLSERVLVPYTFEVELESKTKR